MTAATTIRCLSSERHVGDRPNNHREAAEYAAGLPGPMSFGDRVSNALAWAGMADGLATASAYDAAQIGRYLGEDWLAGTLQTEREAVVRLTRENLDLRVALAHCEAEERERARELVQAEKATSG